MASDSRRIAADARRVASTQGDADRVAVKKVREALAENYERGRAKGREEVQEELGLSDPRALALDTAAEVLDGFLSRVSAIPNSDRTQAAFREAAGILRDVKGAEAPAPTSERQQVGPSASKVSKAVKKDKRRG